MKNWGFASMLPKAKVMDIDWAECFIKCNVLKEYEKVDIFVYSGSSIETNGGSLVVNEE